MAYTGCVATRGRLATTLDLTVNQCMTRSEHVSRDTIASLQIVLSNWYVNGSLAEAGSGGTATWTASVEYPAGTFTQILFSGSASGTCASGSNLVSDACVVSIPINTEFWIRLYQTNATGILYSSRGNTTVGDRIQKGVSGIADVTMSGTAPNGTPGFCAYPTAIIGTTQKRSLVLIGTSRTGGGGESQAGTPGDLGFIEKPFYPSWAGTTLGISGDTVASFVASSTRRVALAKSGYYTDVIFEHGTNDAQQDAGHLATLKTNYGSAQTLLSPMPIYGVTTPPQTTYPANVLVVDYSAFNTWLRTKPNGMTGVLDAAAVLDSGSGTWFNINDTDAGVHITAQGVQRWKSSGLAAI